MIDPDYNFEPIIEGPANIGPSGIKDVELLQSDLGPSETRDVEPLQSDLGIQAPSNPLIGFC